MVGRRDYYPQYYRAKRRRERAVLVISTFVVVGVVIAAIIFLGVYLGRLFRHPSMLEEIVAQKEELATPPAEGPPAVAAEGPAGITAPREQVKLIALEDITEYAESIPEVSIIPQGLGTPGPVETQESPSETEQEAEAASSAEAAAEAPVEASPQVEPEPAAAPSKPESAGAQQRQEPESRRSEANKPAKEKPAKKTPRYVFTAFAGIYKDDSDANRQMARLRELGFKPGKLTRSQAGKKSYLVSVGEPLPEYELAEAVKKKLQEAGFSDAYILRKSAD